MGYKSNGSGGKLIQAISTWPLDTSLLRAIQAGEGVFCQQLKKVLHLALDSVHVSWVSPFSPSTRPYNLLSDLCSDALKSWTKLKLSYRAHYTENTHLLQRCDSPMELNSPQTCRVRKYLDVGPKKESYHLRTPSLFTRMYRALAKVKAPVLEIQPPWLVKETHKLIVLTPLWGSQGISTSEARC